MARITAIEPTRRDPRRVSVFLDGAFGFALDGELALAAGLRVGADLTDAEVAGLTDQDATQRACQAAYQFLGRRPRSEAEVRQRLLRRGFDEPTVAAALRRLRELGYLDDAAFAQFWIDNRREFKPRSARLVAHELRQKGVDREAIDLADWDDEAAALAAGERWIRSRRFADQTDFERRLGSYLPRRGFGYQAIRAAVERLWSTQDNCEREPDRAP